MSRVALFDRALKVAEYSGTAEEIIASVSKVVAGRAYDSSIVDAVRQIVDSGATRCDLPERSESGRCWSRWTVQVAR